jgi:RHS repeat-associated protein
MTTAAQLSENSHQGFDGIKAALCLGSMEVKSNTASGMPLCLWRNGIGSRSSGKERDAETGLDFFGSRYLSAPQGRWISPDPRYFQKSMLIDPQQFNLYIYARNNPLKWLDPIGENLYLAGDLQWLMYEVLGEMAGGMRLFDQAFFVEGGQVLLRKGVKRSELNHGQQLIYDMVESPANFLYYAEAGTDGKAAAKELVDGAANSSGNLTGVGRYAAGSFACQGRDSYCGWLVQTRGRPNDVDPTLPYFAAIGLNEFTAFTEQGRPVSPVSFFIHESAENLEFLKQFGRFDSNFWNYDDAHGMAFFREMMIRLDLTNIPGGFGGGDVNSTIHSSRHR